MARVNGQRDFKQNAGLYATPSDPNHLVNVKWVTEFVSGKVKAPVKLVSVSNIAGTYAGTPDFTLTTTALTAPSIDSVALALGDRVLLAGQTDATQNGVYTISQLGDGTSATVYTRADDFNTSTQITSGMRIVVTEGSVYSDTFWLLATDDPITLDTSDLNFIKVAPTTGATKFTAQITGDATTTDFVVTHNFNTRDLDVSVRDNTTNEIVYPGITFTGVNDLTLYFATAPIVGENYTVIVEG
jgi:hypothetical protein